MPVIIRPTWRVILEFDRFVNRLKLTLALIILVPVRIKVELDS